jgi:hypothetical protein
MKESGGLYSDVSLLGGDPKVAPALGGIEVIRSISLNDTVVRGAGIGPGSDFFFCDPPFGGGGGGGAAAVAAGPKVGATFDSLIIACTMGFWDSK